MINKCEKKIDTVSREFYQDWAIELYFEKVSINQISKKLKFPYSTIRYWLRNLMTPYRRIEKP